MSPQRNTIRFVVTAYKAINKNTLVGCFTLRLDPIGLTIEGCLLHRKGESEWVAFPAKPYTKDGSTTYTKILDFPDRGTWDQFQAVMVPRVKEFIVAQASGEARPQVGM